MATTFEAIFREREVRGEKVVAYLRFTFILVASFFDLLAITGVIAPYTSARPELLTLFLDLLFVLFAGVFATFAWMGAYRPFFKYITISLDYAFIVIMFLLDPSLGTTGQENAWLAVIAPLYLFFLNLIRFSRSAAFYAASLSAIQCVWLTFHLRGDLAIAPVLTFLLPLCMFLLIGLVVNAAGRRMMIEANTKQMLERYLSPQLVDDLRKSRRSLDPGGKRQLVTVLFADIRSFSRISESMGPERVVEMLNDYLSTMTEVIFRHEGTIDKFIGDAILATFGTPQVRSNDPVRAVAAASSMLEALSEFNRRHPELGAPLEIGIGLHTGDVIVGNIGSARRLDYTIIGDTVNLCARIESLTKHYRCPILVSESTLKAFTEAGGKTHSREIDTVIVQGKTEPVVIHEILPTLLPVQPE